MIKTPHKLELHVTHRCNLSCESCSHYSNHGHSGDITPEVAEEWMSRWSRRMEPARINLLGGEPTLNPHLIELMRLTRRHWPDATMYLITNGFFLIRHPELGSALEKTRCRLSVSVHHDSLEYQTKLTAIKAVVGQWKRKFGFRSVFHDSFSTWTRRYHGFGQDMKPFADGSPRASWEGCPAKTCRQLHDGMLWKCAPLAYLKMQNQKHALGEEWEPYLKYAPLESSCSDAELEKFLGLEDEPVCGMCPANPARLEKPDPRKKK